MVAGSESSFAVVNATLLTNAPLAARGDTRGEVTEADLGIVRNATLVAERGVIVAAGSNKECAEALARAQASAEVVDARGALVMPGLVDAHTHALFAGNRIPDFEAIAAGRQPQQGIRFTVEQTRRCSVEQLEAIGAERLALMAAHGTTTAEVKSGYALTARGEQAMLQALQSLNAGPGLPRVVPTFCGAHALPPEHDDYDAFVDALCDEILPAVAALNIARFADAFCETGFFTVAQSERFLRACAAAGMQLRIHADELSHSGGAHLAAALRCRSADHCNFITNDDVRALAAAGCVAVLCPATVEYLGLPRYAPARELLEAGVPVALATDFNPGTSPCPSLQTVAHLARRRLRMTAPETIAAVTLTAAASLQSERGVIAPGRAADVVILDIADFREFGYYYGANVVRCAFVGGRRAGFARRSAV